MSSKNRDSRSDALVVMAESGMPPSAATSPTVSGAAPRDQQPVVPGLGGFDLQGGEPASQLGGVAGPDLDGAAGAGAELLEGAACAQPAVGDDHDVVDGLLDLREVVAGDEHGPCRERRSGVGSRAASGCPPDRARWWARREPGSAGRRAARPPARAAAACRASSRRPCVPRLLEPDLADDLLDPVAADAGGSAVARRWFRAERQGWKVFASSSAPTVCAGCSRSP